jgi:hypothetical protein
VGYNEELGSILFGIAREEGLVEAPALAVTPTLPPHPSTLPQILCQIAAEEGLLETREDLFLSSLDHGWGDAPEAAPAGPPSASFPALSVTPTFATPRPSLDRYGAQSSAGQPTLAVAQPQAEPAAQAAASVSLEMPWMADLPLARHERALAEGERTMVIDLRTFVILAVATAYSAWMASIVGLSATAPAALAPYFQSAATAARALLIHLGI